MLDIGVIKKQSLSDSESESHYSLEGELSAGWDQRQIGTADKKICEIEHRVTGTTQSEREQRDNLENKKFKEEPRVCNWNPGRSWKMGKEILSLQI